MWMKRSSPLFLCMLLLLVGCNPLPKPVEPPIVVPSEHLSPLTGKEPYPTSPLLWVVDNHPQARPQDGIAAADIIYEVPVEGGMTRFLLLTNGTSSSIIGPIRSARGFFTLIAAEYDAIIMHHGESLSFSGAVEAMGGTHVDLTSINSQPIWRDGGRVAPHNLYSNIAQARDYVGQSVNDDYAGRRWVFTTRHPGTVTQINLRYPGGYSVEYRYINSGLYERTTEGTKEEYVVENILIQQTTVRDGAEVSVELLASGPAYFFTKGQAHSGIWVKDSPSGATKFLDSKGEEWQLTSGKTIIHVVPILTTVQYR
ncbi:MAG: DUF3048 domain-containing protein [Peptococcaceae bacterium]|nr:DUF3048 domain-containing protein [Peptococcaceae bacterium]